MVNKKKRIKQFCFILILLSVNNFNCLCEPTKKIIYYYSVWGEFYYQKNKASFFNTLFEEFEVIYTKSLKNLSNFEYIITEEVPRKDAEIDFLARYPHEKILLFSFETQISNPRSQNIKYHPLYSKIFTWNDDFIDNIKYFKVRYPWMDPRPMIDDIPSFQQKKLCVLVANNISKNCPYENYSRRRTVIKFFEENASHDFDLYGNGWQSKTCKGTIPFGVGDQRRLEKINCLKNYKFDICFENTKGINGWLSERIFESFAAGCIPIYSGSKNITNYIPKNCFIDADQFIDIANLYIFLKNMSSEEFYQYIENIRIFLNSGKTYNLTTNYYLKNIRIALGLPIKL